MNTRTARAAFIVFFLIMVAAFIYMAAPMIKPIFLAVIVSILFHPVYVVLLRWMRQHNYCAAVATTALCFGIVLLPLAVLLTALSMHVVEFVVRLAEQVQAGSLDPLISQIGAAIDAGLARLPTELQFPFDLRTAVLEALKTSAGVLYQYSPRVLATTAQIALGLILMVIFMVVFFAEGSRLFAWFLRCLPLSASHQREISRDIRVMISALLLGVAGTALCQGLLIGGGMWVAGFANAGMWTLIAIVICFIPIVGAAGFYTATAITLAGMGRWEAGLAFFLFGALIVSSIDNFLRPLVMSGKMHVHPVLLFIALLGGVRAFGPIGVLVGPVLLAVFLTSLKIYQREFADNA